jgi:cytochrome c-type biogenesis protein CcmH/NrfG
MGKALVALGDYREAAAAYEQAVRRSPWVRAGDLHQLAGCLRRSGRSARALEVERLLSTVDAE